MAFNPISVQILSDKGADAVTFSPPPSSFPGAKNEHEGMEVSASSPVYELSALAAIRNRHDGQISGVVLVEGLPSPYAVVRLYYRPTGVMISQLKCKADGTFMFEGLADLQSENHYVVALDPEGGYSYNAKIFDKLKPVSTAPWQVRPLSMYGGVCGLPTMVK